jgi:hypothetical protein
MALANASSKNNIIIIIIIISQPFQNPTEIARGAAAVK